MEGLSQGIDERHSSSYKESETTPSSYDRGSSSSYSSYNGISSSSYTSEKSTYIQTSQKDQSSGCIGNLFGKLLIGLIGYALFVSLVPYWHKPVSETSSVPTVTSDITSSGSEVMPPSTDPILPYAIDSHIDYIKAKSILMKSRTGKIRINNFFLNATWNQDDTGVLHGKIPVDSTILSTSKYVIDYDSVMLWSNPMPQYGCFEIDFMQDATYGSPEQVSAEEYLMTILGVTKSNFCKLPVSEGFGDAGVQRLPPIICQ